MRARRRPRRIGVLKAIDDALLRRVRAARTEARARVWDAGARHTGAPPQTITLNIDATLLTAHSRKSCRPP